MLGALIHIEAAQVIADGRVDELAKKSNITRSWFYQMAERNEPNPTAKNIERFLLAIDHPLVVEIKQHLLSVDVGGDNAGHITKDI
ncbi:hypothetical protein [Pseudoalteromonas ulvae]|uniref:Uncharacterized protein n=1 Tax=Pseudoalteromonas ulvae TaxID=107327 RepID=A0A244CUE8_PSEDV|nr:hypothetical protein [Pseudoalteromonas ulvae]OUL59237.1 hypothetical protein B1199_02930 [Pseudoalteromonas ulvae]